MTTYKIYRIDQVGRVYVDIAESYDWISLIQNEQYKGHPIFKVEIYGVSVSVDA